MDRSKEVSVLIENCPLCGSKMDKGYIIVGGTNRWIGLDKVWMDKVPLSIKFAIHGGGALHGFPIMIADAHRCQNCKVILFSYKESQAEKRKEKQ